MCVTLALLEATNSSSVRCGMLPTPDEPIGTGCDAFRLLATNSAAFDAVLRGFTTKIVELLTTSDIGAKSRTGSYGSASYSAGLIATAPTVVRNSTDPSAGALAT